MIPILYDDGEKAFVTNGIGRLSDCLSCFVTEERNGIYECEFEYPITGERYADITEGQIIYCTHDDTKEPQAFIIYGRSAPISGVVTFYAHHISYKLRTTVVTPFTASSITDAIDKLPRNTIPQTNFTFWTDKSVVGQFKVTEPRAVRGVLGGEDGSLLDVYGKGDYEWDMFTVKLYQSRGTDSEIEIRYGKNLINVTNEIDASDTYNAITPFWKGENEDGSEALVTLPEGVIVYSGATRKLAYLTDENLVVIRDENGEPLEVTYTDINVIAYDMSGMFLEKPTVEELREAAVSYLESSDGWVQKQNITVDFVQMWQTEEYKEYAPLQRARLCDTVSVFYPELGVEAVKKKVIRTKYNVLMDRYDEIELGDVQYSFADVIAQTMLETVPTKSMMDDAIKHATEMISGGLGGYVVLKPNANGVPEEILIMDAPDIASAVNVVRMNKNGIGFSNTGYSGTYRTAWTIDGNFVADFITAGTLNANLIKAGILSDVGGNTTFNLETGQLDITNGSIDLGNGNFYVNDEGYVFATWGQIGGFDISANGFTYNYERGSFSIAFGMASEQTSVNDETLYLTCNGFSLLSFKPSGFYMYPINSSGSGWGTTFFELENSKVYIGHNVGGSYLVDNTGIDLIGKTVDIYASGSSASDAIVSVTQNGLTLRTGRRTTAHSGNLYITATGVAYYANEGSSSRKIKRDIEPVKEESLNPAKLYDIDVIQYKYKDDFLSEDDENLGKTLVGFIVEDLDETYPTVVQKETDDSKTWTWSPYRIIPPMLKLIQDQKKEIDELRAEIKEIKDILERRV